MRETEKEYITYITQVIFLVISLIIFKKPNTPSRAAW